MVTAIRLSDGVSTVSPSYAMEVQQPSDMSTGFSGGEGLELELREAYADGRLIGILNGCMYPEKTDSMPGWDALLQLIGNRPEIINASQPAVDWLDSCCCRSDVLQIRKYRYSSNQLVNLTQRLNSSFLHWVRIPCSSCWAAVRNISRNGLRQSQLRSLSDPLYSAADLFLMPSSFEPCGISQMLAMRAGQPCVVHAVGGLKDTVRDGVTGFVFEGGTPGEQAEAFTKAVQRAITIRSTDKERWQEICNNAKDERFSWDLAAKTYMQRLYRDA